MTVSRAAVPALFLALLSGGACGSSGSNADAAGGKGGGGSGGTTGGGSCSSSGAAAETTWKENGVARCSFTTLAVRTMNATSDTLELVAVDIVDNATLTIIVSSMSALGGSYACVVDGGAPVVEVTYDNDASTPVQSCNVAVAFQTAADGQLHATGTFDIAIAGKTGPIALSDGHYDVPVKQNGG